MSHLKTFSYSYKKNIKKNKDESNNIDLLNKNNTNLINLTKIYNNEKVKQKKKKLILKSNTLFNSLGYNSADNLFNIDNIEKTNKNFDQIKPIKKEDCILILDYNNNDSTDMTDSHKKQFKKYFLTENNSYNSNLVLSDKKSKLNNYLTEETDIEYLNKLNERHYEKKNCSKQTLTPKQLHEIDELIEKDNYRRIKEKKLKEINNNKNKKNNDNLYKKLKNKLNNIKSINNNNDNSNQNNSFRSNNECDICAMDSKNCVTF
jgi:hypothetical protein